MRAGSSIALAALTWLLAAPCACALDHVVLQLKWHHQFQFAGYYAAVEQGYYREAGLDVELREAQPEEDPIQEVLQGRANFGVGTSDLVLLRAQGKPVVVLAVIYQHSPFVLLTPASSGIHDVQALANKPIMMEPGAAELLAYFKNEGVDPARLKIVPHTFEVRDLLNGRAVAMSAYSTDEPFRFKADGVPYLIFSPRAGGIDFYGDNLFTTEAEIRAHPERVKAFLDASLRGWDYAMKHPGEIVNLLLRDYPRGKSRDHLLFEAEETAKLVHPELIELGYVNPGRWKAIADTYADLGMMTRNFSLKGFIYERDPHLDLRWLYWTGGAVSLLALGMLGWSLLTAQINRRLRAEVEARRRAEALVRAESESKTRFFAVLAHEVRSPLSGIISSLDLWRNPVSDLDRDEIAHIAQRSAGNLLQTVDEMLDQARLEAGQMPVEALPVKLATFLEEIVDLFRASAVTKGIDIRLEIEPGTPAVVMTDPTRLRQILSNMVSNAVKFTDRGFVKILASAVPLEGGYALVIEVVDSGPGLTPEQMERIFEPYAQAERSTARRYGGTGLGLSISMELARLLGGEITVASDGCTGATFAVKIQTRAAGSGAL